MYIVSVSVLLFYDRKYRQLIFPLSVFNIHHPIPVIHIFIFYHLVGIYFVDVINNTYHFVWYFM